jgi:glycine/serine hydroxymethyltransferase
MRARWRRTFIARGYRIVSGGTDNHLFLLEPDRSKASPARTPTLRSAAPTSP